MTKPLSGCGIGLRSEFIDQLLTHPKKPSWLEVTPENWIATPPTLKKTFESIARDFPLAAHGLSLSIGSNTPIDYAHLDTIKTFLDRYEIDVYSEHLSYCSLDHQQLYELLPLPMTEAMVSYLSDRIHAVQDFLKRPLILENPSYYHPPYAEMKESDFISEVITRSGCKLLLDLNNVYVNAHNFKFNPKAFIDALPLKSIAYMHIAGHLEYRQDLFIDTHGEAIKQEVFELFTYVRTKGVHAPILLERDTQIPPYDLLLEEYWHLEEIDRGF